MPTVAPGTASAAAGPTHALNQATQSLAQGRRRSAASAVGRPPRERRQRKRFQQQLSLSRIVCPKFVTSVQGYLSRGVMKPVAQRVAINDFAQPDMDS